jgi:hypothetical protein
MPVRTVRSKDREVHHEAMRRLLVIPIIAFLSSCGQVPNAVPQSSPAVSSLQPTRASSPTPSRATLRSSQRARSSQTKTSAFTGIAGHVVNGNDQAISGVCVTTHVDAEGKWGRRTDVKTDASGNYKIKLPYPGNPILVEIWDCHATPFFAPFERRGISPRRGQTITVDAVLKPGASVEGRVVDAGGNPLPEICVDAFDGRSDVNRYFSIYSVPSEANGSFRISGLAPSTIRLRFAGCEGSSFVAEWYDGVPAEEQYAGDFDQAASITLSAGKTTSVGNVELSRR